ncbi:ABC subfamily G member 4, partial [Rhyzopertha dominica]
RRQILKHVNGKFNSGSLTAILGPSGAGKSTLLNILAGYVSVGVSGCIKTNGRARQMKYFHKISSYIMQEDLLQPRLTVSEAMIVAAKLKLGSDIGYDEKLLVVQEVLELLGLEGCSNTRTEYLSGGQRKRLSVALELVNNPPVIFLDEPTTGLDTVAIKQCLSLLHNLTRQGRTVICTIHQPTASEFSMFDQVYFLANGHCIYNGEPASLVPFLSSSGMICPPTYTPADYIIELVQNNIDHVSILSHSTQNGKINHKCDTISKLKLEDDSIFIESDAERSNCYSKKDVRFPTNFWTQFSILLGRMFLQMRRNKPMLVIQLLHHILSAILVGSIFYKIGDNAGQMIANFKYCLSIVAFFMYTYVMVPVLIFPLEVKLLKREYFNRWYGLKAYYLALTISTLPLLTVLGVIFMCIVYTLTDQPWESSRFVSFLLMGWLVGFASQGLGYSIGSICSITNGSVVGPAVLAPLLALAVYGMGYKGDIEPMMKFLMTFSYLRYALVGFTDTLFNNRAPLKCLEEELYCHYKDPQLLMRDMGMDNTKLENQVMALIIFTVLFRMVAFLALRYRLTAEFSVRIVNYATKIFRHKA